MYSFKIFTTLVTSIGLLAFSTPTQAQRCPDAGTFTGTGYAVNPLHPTEPQRVNRFNWQTATYPTWFGNNNNTNNLVQMHSPFYQPANSHILPLVLSNDTKPQEGWELVYDERGFESQINNPTTTAPAHTAVVLYNRNTGILRVIAARAAQFTDYNAARISLSFADGSKLPSTLAMALPLTGVDKFQNEALVAATNFNQQQYMWFYADFPMTYDPCTCQGNTILKASISFIKNSTISLKGSTLGELVSVQNNTGTVKRPKGPWTLQNLQGSAKKATEMYNSLDQWKNDTKSAIYASGKPAEEQKKNEVATNAIIKFLREAQVGTLLDQIPMVGAAFAFIEAFTGVTPEPAGPQLVEVAPMVMTADHEFTGEITEISPQFDIIFRLSGSQEVAGQNVRQPYYDEILGQFNLLETPTVYQRHVRYFNEVQTPFEYSSEEKTYDYFGVDVYSIKPVINKAVFEENYDNIKYGLVFDFSHVQRLYATRTGKDSMVQVAKNVEELSKVLGRELNFVGYDAVKPTDSIVSLLNNKGGSFSNTSEPRPMNYGIEQDYYKIRRYTDRNPKTGEVITYLEYKWRYRTPLLCLACIGEVEGESNLFNNFYSIFMNSWIELVQSLDPDYPFSWSNVRVYPQVEKVNLRVVAALKTKPTPYSSNSRTVLAERTFEVNVKHTYHLNDEYAQPLSIISHPDSPANVEEIVTIDNITVNSGVQEFIAWDGFIIGDNIKVAAGAKVLLTSIGQHLYDKDGNKVPLPTGFEFKDPSNPVGTTGYRQFICKYDSEYSTVVSAYSNVANSEIASFCSSKQYKGASRNYARIEHDVAAIQQPTVQLNSNINAYPNPANDKVVITYRLQNHSQVSITLYDLLGNLVGEVVGQREQEAGMYEVEFLTKNLSDGLYICVIQTNDTKESLKLIISK
ncbi:MAG: T9SS type A sorting domain-containing protein [Thermoflexibacteraceae bacterium]